MEVCGIKEDCQQIRVGEALSNWFEASLGLAKLKNDSTSRYQLFSLPE